MANEIDVTALPIKLWRSELQLYASKAINNQQIDDATAVQVSTALPNQTQMVSIYNSGTNRNYFMISDDTATAVTATNGQSLGAGITKDVLAAPGQKIQFLRG